MFHVCSVLLCICIKAVCLLLLQTQCFLISRKYFRYCCCCCCFFFPFFRSSFHTFNHASAFFFSDFCSFSWILSLMDICFESMNVWHWKFIFYFDCILHFKLHSSKFEEKLPTTQVETDKIHVFFFCWILISFMQFA